MECQEPPLPVALLFPGQGSQYARALDMHGAKKSAWNTLNASQALKDYVFDRWFSKIPYSPKRPKRRHLPYVDSPKNADWHVERRHGATKRFALRCFATRPLCHENIRISMSSWAPRSKACLIKQNQFLASSQDFTNLYVTWNTERGYGITNKVDVHGRLCGDESWMIFP